MLKLTIVKLSFRVVFIIWLLLFGRLAKQDSHHNYLVHLFALFQILNLYDQLFDRLWIVFVGLELWLLLLDLVQDLFAAVHMFSLLIQDRWILFASLLIQDRWILLAFLDLFSQNLDCLSPIFMFSGLQRRLFVGQILFLFDFVCVVLMEFRQLMFLKADFFLEFSQPISQNLYQFALLCVLFLRRLSFVHVDAWLLLIYRTIKFYV